MIDNLFHLKSQQDQTPLHKFQRFSFLGKLWNGNFLSMSPFPCHFVSQPPPALPIISCLCSPIPPNILCLCFSRNHFVPLPSPIHFMPVTLSPILCFPSTSPQFFRTLRPLPDHLVPPAPFPIYRYPMDKYYQNLLSYPIPVESAIQALNDRGPEESNLVNHGSVWGEHSWINEVLFLFFSFLFFFFLQMVQPLLARLLPRALDRQALVLWNQKRRDQERAKGIVFYLLPVKYEGRYFNHKVFWCCKMKLKILKVQ